MDHPLIEVAESDSVSLDGNAKSMLLAESADFDEAFEVGPVSGFPRFEYDQKNVADSGDIIAGELPWAGALDQRILDAFLIANNWRDAHAFPMRSIRRQAIFLMGRSDIKGLSAARLKRMQAIRRKLRRLPNLKLNKLQDLGGVRIVLPSISDVRTITELLIGKSGHELRHRDDYIDKPKKDGYRCQHLMFNYLGKGEAAVFTGKRVEVQVRTLLQHSWATAVEAVGMFRGEDLKSEKTGSQDWLSLFKLMSAEFARMEDCPESTHVPDHKDRVREIIELDKKLKASNTLENLSNAVRWTEISIAGPHRPSYYLINYDNKSNVVTVSPYFSSKPAVASYDSAEYLDNVGGTENKNIVLVEADKVHNLREAYPNYFGDVQLFKAALGTIVNGKDIKDYEVKPQERVSSFDDDRPVGAGWMLRRRFNKPKGA